MLVTERLILRPWRDADREPFSRMVSDPRVMEFFPSTLTREESDSLVDRIQAHYEKHGFTFFAAELRESGEFTGFIGVANVPFESHFTPAVEIGWRLSFTHWKRGLATEGARAALRHAFEELRLPEVVALTVPANVRSRRVMEKLGMSYNPVDDFEHPRLPEGHPIRPHVLYRVTPAQAILHGAAPAQR
jgi:ribosomal-protein-alanine N-acetyltransferase